MSPSALAPRADRYRPAVAGGSISTAAITWPSSAASSRHCRAVSRAPRCRRMACRYTGQARRSASLPRGVRTAKPDQADGGQLVHHPAHPGPAEHRPLAQLAHPQPGTRRGVQLEQHVVPGQRNLSGGPQVSLDRGHQPAVRHQQAAPRVDHGIRVPRPAGIGGTFCRSPCLCRAAARETVRHGRQPTSCVCARAHILCACARSFLMMRRIS